MVNDATMKIDNGTFWHLACNGDEFVFNSKSAAVEKLEELGESPDNLTLREIESDDSAGKFSVKGVSWKEIASMVMD